MRQHAEFDLRVVRRDEHTSGIRREGAADLATGGRTHRDVLQVGIAAAQAPSCGNGLVEAGVQAAGFRIDEQRQRVDVRAFQLGELAPLQDEPRQLVRLREFLEDVSRGGRRFRLRVAPQGGQLQLVEQDARQLLWRGDVERLARHAVDVRRAIGEVGFQAL